MSCDSGPSRELAQDIRSNGTVIDFATRISPDGQYSRVQSAVLRLTTGRKWFAR